MTEEARQWYDEGIVGDTLKEELTIPAGYPVPAAEPAPIRRRPRAVEKTRTVYETLIAHVQSVKADFSLKHTRESDQAFLARILLDVGESVPVSLEAWVNAADTAQEAGKALPLPEGYPAAPAKAVEPKAEPKYAEGTNGAAKPLTAIEEYNRKLAAGEVPPRRKRTAKPREDKPEKEAKAPGKRTGRIARNDSTTALIRDAVTHNQEITIEELTQILQQHGKQDISTMTITTTRASHIAAIRSLQRCGWAPTAAAE
jgi:hypothetical protein